MIVVTTYVYQINHLIVCLTCYINCIQLITRMFLEQNGAKLYVIFEIWLLCLSCLYPLIFCKATNWPTSMSFLRHFTPCYNDKLNIIYYVHSKNMILDYPKKQNLICYTWNVQRPMVPVGAIRPIGVKIPSDPFRVKMNTGPCWAFKEMGVTKVRNVQYQKHRRYEGTKKWPWHF